MLNKNPLQSYQAPSQKRLLGDLLASDQAYKSIKQLVAPILAVAKQYGVTFSSDGWSYVQRRPILNFMASTRAAAAFLKSIECTDHPLQCCEDAT